MRSDQTIVGTLQDSFDATSKVISDLNWVILTLNPKDAKKADKVHNEFVTLREKLALLIKEVSP